MCGCTSSFGPDRYGPIYAGRYGFLGGAPARMPWLEEQAARAGAWLGPAGAAAGGPKVDPSCPGCRVGAYAAGEALPAQAATFAAGVLAPAGQLAYGSMAGPPRAVLDPTRGLGAPVGAYPIGFGAPPAVTFDVLGPVLAGVAAAPPRDPYDAGRWVAPGVARPAVVYSRVPGYMVY